MVNQTVWCVLVAEKYAVDVLTPAQRETRTYCFEYGGSRQKCRP